ncbi:MAG: hypothetical protein PVG25_09935, partial [Anaerolineae bacterium]
ERLEAVLIPRRARTTERMRTLNGQSRAALVTAALIPTWGWPVPEWKLGGCQYPPPSCPGAEGGGAYPPQVLTPLSRFQWLQSIQWPH